MERPHVRTPTGRRVAALGSLAGALLLLAAAVAVPAQAAPGDLDLTFSGDGKQRTDFGFGASSAAATVRQPDGKIVAVGRASASDSGDFALARYNPNGSLDTSFSGDGRQTTDFGNFDGANGVALQGDGKIVAVGVGGDATHYGFALARYNPNGTLDTSFSGDGRQTTDFGSSDQANAVALQGGKIVAVGSAGGDFALARYNPNGSLDTSFSGDGKQTTDSGFDGANAVALQGGKIVAVGSAAGDFALARYNANGSLDTGFSGDGKQTTNFGGTDVATGVALQTDGKLVAVGRTGGIASDFALARYNANGSLDTGFSGDGKQTTDFGSFEVANGVALQGDGKIVAVGSAGFSGDFALARYNPNGSLDTSFSADGRQTTDFGGFDQANGAVLQGGKIVAVGAAGFGDFALARYNADGTLDTSFSGDGRQTTSFPGFDGAAGVALQTDGKIVAVGGAGTTDESGADDFALARYNPSGTLDTSFSGDGRQTTDFGDFDGAAGMALQGDGKIVAVGRTGGCQCSTSPTPDDFALARYNPNGSLDTSFSGDGKQTTTFRDHGFDDFDGATGVVLQGDGKIVAVGLGAGDFALARYKPNGSLDTSFSGDGKQTTSFSVGGFDEASGVVLQGDGRIVAAGGTGTGDFALARYNANGTLDTSFSGDGKQTTSFSVGGLDRAGGVALQGDGKIVAAGGTGTGDFALARYNANGTLDLSFSGDGRQTTNFGGGDRARGVALQGDGNIVAVGIGLGTDQTSDFALARYLGG